MALLWTVLSLPVFGIFEAVSVWEDRRALRRDGMLTALAQRHYERALVRLVLLILIMAIGVSSLFTSFVPPVSPRGWLILVGLFLIPVLIQVDAIRDHQLRQHVMRRPRHRG